MVRELRHPDDVFHADSLASLEDVPVTIGHPAGNAVTPSNAARAVAGHVRAGSVRADGELVRASLVLARQDAIEGAERKTLAELSAGYGCVIDPTPGEYAGQRYDQRQTAIRYNHVAMLEPGKGRMGAQCRLDAAGEEIPETVQDDPPMKLTINGKEFEGAEAQAEVTKLAARADALTVQVADLSKAVAAHDAEVAKAKRSALEAKVKPVLGAEFKADASDRDLRVAVIKRADSSFNAEGRDDVYVEARFDATLAPSSKAAEVVAALNGTGASRADAAAALSPEAIRNAHLEGAKKLGVSV